MKKYSLNVKEESIHSCFRFGLISFSHCVDLVSYSHLPTVKKLQIIFLNNCKKNWKDNTVKPVLTATSTSVDGHMSIMSHLIPSQPKYIVTFHNQPLNNGYLGITATIFVPNRWLLYTGLIVLLFNCQVLTWVATKYLIVTRPAWAGFKTAKGKGKNMWNFMAKVEQ